MSQKKQVKRLGWTVPAAIVMVSPVLAQTARAESYVWTPTNGGTFSWIDETRWNPGEDANAFPSAATDDANLNINILGSQTIDLDQSIAIRDILIGDTNASHVFSISSGTGTNTLGFSTLTHVSGQVSLNASLAGNGTIYKNSVSSLTFNGTNTAFTGVLDMRYGLTQFNNPNARLSGVTHYILRGTSTFDIGGSTLTEGTNRLNSAGTMTFYGGRFVYAGTFAAATVSDEAGPAIHVAEGSGVFDFRPGAGTTVTKQTELTLGNLTRDQGAILQLRADSLGGIDETASGSQHRLLAGNVSTYLIGGGGAANTSTASIIPWLLGGTGSAIVSNQPRDFLTYSSTNGFQVAANGPNNANTAGATENYTHTSSGTHTLTGIRTVNSVKFTNSGTLIIGAHQLNVTSGGIIMGTGTSSITSTTGTLNFGTAEGVIHAWGSHVNTVSAAITGSGGLTKGSTGTLILSGDNSYTGDTHIAGGMLRMGFTNAVDAASNLYVANGNAATLNGGVPTLAAWDLGGFNQAVAGLGGGGEFGGHTDLRNATLTIGKAAATSITYSGVVSGLGGNIAKTGTNTQVLAGNNTYTGTTSVGGGILRAGSGHAFGDSASAVSVATGGTVDLAGFNQVAGKSYVLDGGALVNSSTSQAVSIGTGASVTVNPGSSYSGADTTPTVTFSAPDQPGTTATGTVVMTLTGFTIDNVGAGYSSAPSVTISAPDVAGGAPAYATATVVNGEVTAINLINPGTGYTSIPTITLSTAGSTTAAVVTPVAAIQGVLMTDGGSGYTTAPTVTFSAGTSTATGTGGFSSITVNSASSIGGNGALTINPVITGAGSLTKIGTGTTTFTNANLYGGGTNVSAGTLVVTNTIGSATGSGAVQVDAAATLAGNGSISGDVTVDGRIAPGTDVADLGTGNLTINGAYAAKTDFTTSDSDTINVTGTVTLGESSVLELSALNVLSAGQLAQPLTVVVIDNDGEDAVTGEFGTVLPGQITGLFEYAVAYNYDTLTESFGGGNDVAVTFTAVPEPSSLALLALGGFGLLRRRRRA